MQPKEQIQRKEIWDQVQLFVVPLWVPFDVECLRPGLTLSGHRFQFLDLRHISGFQGKKKAYGYWGNSEGQEGMLNLIEAESAIMIIKGRWRWVGWWECTYIPKVQAA